MKSFFTSLAENYNIQPAPASGHHNEAQITAEQAIDSFMHFILNQSTSSLVQMTKAYYEKQNLAPEVIEEWLEKLDDYGDALQIDDEDMSDDYDIGDEDYF